MNRSFPQSDIAMSSRPFHVLAKPSGPICNLDCDYCFYLDKVKLFPNETRFRMSDDVLERYTQQYIDGHPPGTREINFAWQGGEPTLMGVDFFRRALDYQKKYGRTGVTITNALQTNGTRLDDEWGRFLHDNGFLVGISIDGPEAIHDRFRRDKGRRGTFQQVMRGLAVLQRHKVEFNTLTVVQRENGDAPVAVYDCLRDIGSTFMQFIPIVEHDNGVLSERSVRPQQYGTFLNGIFDRWRMNDIGQVYIQLFELMLAVTMGYPASLCVHSRTCGRAVAIEHDGTLFSCDHFVFPEYELGNIAERTLAEMLDSQMQTKFGNDKADTLPRYCRKCDYLEYCYGGCPAHRIKTTPDGEDGLNYLCEGYLRFYSYTKKFWLAMAECLRRQMPATEYERFLQRPPSQTVSGAKVGRNEPCPCGSGRKFKKCCGT